MRTAILTLSLVCSLGCAARQPVARGDEAAQELLPFNEALRAGTLRMDNPALVALWEEDGVCVLPGEKPLQGRAAVAHFMDEVTRPIAGAHMELFELRCFDQTVAGDWASEWCEEHQRVILPNGAQPFDGRGRLLFVLHRGPDGRFRIFREMWNQAGPAAP